MQVKRGTTRTVLLTRRHAVKVPSFRPRGVLGRGMRGRLASFARGLLANQSEHDWCGFEPWAGQVAPVLKSWLGGVVQLYPRADPLPDGYAGPLPKLEPCPGDVKAANCGVLAGRIVFVDYDMSTGLPCGQGNLSSSNATRMPDH